MSHRVKEALHIKDIFKFVELKLGSSLMWSNGVSERKKSVVHLLSKMEYSSEYGDKFPEYCNSSGCICIQFQSCLYTSASHKWHCLPLQKSDNDKDGDGDRAKMLKKEPE